MFQQKRLEKLGESNPWTLKSEFNQVLSKPCHYVFADGISQRILRKCLFWKKISRQQKITKHFPTCNMGGSRISGKGVQMYNKCVGGSLC